MKVPSVTCGTHGKQPQTFVCVHIIESIREGEPKGFWWSRGEDGVWDAVCDQCNNLSQEEFDTLGPDNIGVICLGCFEDAAALNEIELEQGAFERPHKANRTPGNSTNLLNSGGFLRFGAQLSTT